jgi:hypothetical protein
VTSRSRISALSGLQAAGPEASTDLESNVVTRSVVGLVVGAGLGAAVGAFWGWGLYHILYDLYTRFPEFFVLHTIKLATGLYVGLAIGLLVGVIAGLIFAGSVDFRKEYKVYVVFGVFGVFLLG